MGGGIALGGPLGGPKSPVGDALGGPLRGAMRGEAGNVLGGGPKDIEGGPVGGPEGGGTNGVEATGGPITKGKAGKLLLDEAVTVGVAIGTDPGGTKVEAVGVGVGIGAPIGIGGGLRMAVGASSTKFFNRSFCVLVIAAAASISKWSSGLMPNSP